MFDLKSLLEKQILGIGQLYFVYKQQTDRVGDGGGVNPTGTKEAGATGFGNGYPREVEAAVEE